MSALTQLPDLEALRAFDTQRLARRCGWSLRTGPGSAFKSTAAGRTFLAVKPARSIDGLFASVRRSDQG
jgi:hypothetical protein